MLSVDWAIPSRLVPGEAGTSMNLGPSASDRGENLPGGDVRRTKSEGGSRPARAEPAVGAMPGRVRLCPWQRN